MASRHTVDPADPDVEIDELTEVRRFEGHAGTLVGTHFVGDGSRIVSVATDNTVRVWDRTTGKQVALLSGLPAPPVWLDASSDGSVVAAGDKKTGVRVWDGVSGELLHGLPANRAGYGVDVSADGMRFVTGSNDLIRFWNVADGSPTPGPKFTAYAVAIHKARGWYVQGGWNGVFRVYDLANNAVLFTSEKSAGHVYGAAFSGDGERLITSNWDGTTRVWNTADWSLAESRTGHRGASIWLSQSADGTRYATNDDAGIARIWQVGALHPIQVFEDSGKASISPDGKFALTGDASAIVLWRLPDRK